jgi:Secretion system C-terminal sorting domain
MVLFTKWKTYSKLLLLSITLISFLTSPIIAQTAELQYNIESFNMSSGLYNGVQLDGGETILAYNGIVRSSDAPWLRVFFKDANLGKNSFIIMRSVWDGKEQRLDAISIKQWQNSSAYFNGYEVEIELHVAAFDENIFFNINELAVGEFIDGDDLYFSQCGPTDDRISSDQLATGRLLNIGCTAWIIPNGHFVSAGHCLDGSGANVVEFQVPPSLPNGTIQHPGPEDQYSVNVPTKEFVNGGVGNDWGTFEVFPNSTTGLMPKEAQGAFWPLVQDLGPDSIRITGYGVDTGVDNQTQQTHVGPNAGSSGTTMRYVTDTEGGNSGSPVIDALTGSAVGVHTHGGCNSSGGNNNGTSTFNSAFWIAIDQGMGDCPVEGASNPNPANATTNVSINIAELTWSNGTGAISNELYFGTDPSSLSLVQSGSLATSWNVTGGPLSYQTMYYWQVVEIGDTCNTNGPIWNFTTEMDPSIQVLFSDDFEDGSLANWTITNDGGTCVWMQYPEPWPNSYTLPPSAGGGVLSADSDECGTGTTLLSTATMNIPVDASLYQTVWVEWDNDWRTIDGADEAHLEISIDGGTTWTTVVSWIGVDKRESHENWDVTSIAALQPSVMFRLISIQPGWDWWWTVDNFTILATDFIPVELTSFTAVTKENNVILNWSTATEVNNSGFEVQRSTNNNEFITAGFIDGKGTVSEVQDYTFTDKNLEVGNYSYRLKQVDYDGTSEYSDIVEVEVLAPNVYSLEQNYPNPFNPATVINFSLASNSKVTLKVFDALGQEVAELVNGKLLAGVHNINFNASILNSGVYFYRINAVGSDGTIFNSVKKMILLK